MSGTYFNLWLYTNSVMTSICRPSHDVNL